MFLIKRATEAYLSGNKAAARALSISAHKLNEQLSELNHEAAVKIFSERNKNILSTKKGPAIDLHGLHPEESCYVLDDTIKKLVSSRYRGDVIIITGTGNHSRGQMKVLPIVREHLENQGWKPRDATLNDGKGGMLVIKI